MNENLDVVNQEPTAAEPKRSKKGLLVGGFLLVIAAAIVLFVVFDPFGLVALLFGGGKITQIVPDDAPLYTEMDLAAFFSDDFQEIVLAFQDAAGIEVEDTEEMYDEFLEDSLGVTLEDIKPWIGQYIGIVVTELDADMMSGYAEPPIVIIIEARDTKGADEFIVDVIDYREDEFGDEFDEFEFDGATFFDNEDDYTPLILGRYKNYVFFADDVDALEDILDLAEKGRKAEGTLADQEMFQSTMAELPTDAMFRMYLNYEVYQDLYSEMLEDVNGGMVLPTVFTDMNAGLGVTVGVVEEGVKAVMTTVYENPEDLPWYDLDIDPSAIQPRTPSMVPEETFLFFSAPIPEGYFEVYMESMGEEYMESFALMEDEIGISGEDMFSSIEGELAFVLFEQNDGFLSELVQTPIGISLLLGTNDYAVWDDLFGFLTDAADMDPTMVLEDVDLENFDLSSLSLNDGFSTYPIILFGTGEDFVVVSTEVTDPDILIGESNTLADSENFQAVWESFPDDSWPVLYVDMEMLSDFIEDVSGGYSSDQPDWIDGMKPLTSIAASSTMLNSMESQTVTVIFFIDR